MPGRMHHVVRRTRKAGEAHQTAVFKASAGSGRTKAVSLSRCTTTSLDAPAAALSFMICWAIQPRTGRPLNET